LRGICICMYLCRLSGVSRYMFMMSTPPNWATGTVPHIFFRDHVSFTSSEFIRVINEVASNSNARRIWEVLLGAVVNDNSYICDGKSFWNAPDFIMCEIENISGANRYTFFSWARQCSFLDIAGTQRPFKTGSSMSFGYLVIISLVTGLMMPLQTSSMLMLY
jgi:hypothetical protein